MVLRISLPTHYIVRCDAFDFVLLLLLNFRRKKCVNATFKMSFYSQRILEPFMCGYCIFDGYARLNRLTSLSLVIRSRSIRIILHQSFNMVVFRIKCFTITLQNNNVPLRNRVMWRWIISDVSFDFLEPFTRLEKHSRKSNDLFSSHIMLLRV